MNSKSNRFGAKIVVRFLGFGIADRGVEASLSMEVTDLAVVGLVEIIGM